MRKKKDTYGTPTYSKKYATNAKGHSKSKHHQSILTKHEQKLDMFKNKRNRLITLNTQINDCKTELEKSDNIQVISHIQKTIQDLKDEHTKIESGEDEMNYLLESSHIVVELYALQQKEQELLNNKIFDETLQSVINRKNELTEQYLEKFEPDYINIKITKDVASMICYSCNSPLQFNEGFLVCFDCGFCTYGLETSQELSYKELQDYDYRPQFTYDKESHLMDWLRRFEDKENKEIPRNVLDQVIMEAKKERITNLDLLTEDKVRNYLRKLNLNTYFDNTIGIINRINGRKSFRLTSEVEQQIRTMFMQIQDPFEKHKPPKRKNFLSYSYVLHKFFQILGLHEFAKYFPLLKSADKLRQQDEIFKKIVRDMALTDQSVKWVFYPSI
jgi:hypothetical protein